MNDINSDTFFNLKIYNELEFNLMIGARALMASCLPLVANPCNNLLYLTNLGSSAKSSTMIKLNVVSSSSVLSYHELSFFVC